MCCMLPISPVSCLDPYVDPVSLFALSRLNEAKCTAELLQVTHGESQKTQGHASILLDQSGVTMLVSSDIITC